jgi:hypothetical protein
MVSVNGIYKVAVLGSSEGQQHIHTLHFRSTLNPTSVALAEQDYMRELLAEWQSGCRAAYRNLFRSFHSPCLSYQVRKVCGSTPLPAGVDITETVGNSVGTGPDDGTGAMAPWLAQVTTIRTGLQGRRFRGRFFIGGLMEGNVAAATISAERNARTQAYADALLDTFITPADPSLVGKLFVWSRTESEEDGVACQNAGADAVSFQVRDQLATMKSRKLGSGI